MQQLITREVELDRKEASRNVYDLRSFSPDDLCQYCESTDGTVVVWDNPELVWEGDWSVDVMDTFTLENCPECNSKGESK